MWYVGVSGICPSQKGQPETKSKRMTEMDSMRQRSVNKAFLQGTLDEWRGVSEQRFWAINRSHSDAAAADLVFP